MRKLNNSLQVAAVVIGRNEGQRLVACLDSLLNSVDHIIYVDSGSLDNSLSEAEDRKVDCLSLDMSLPFTAARARNEGADYLLKKYPQLAYIQFVDGDCEVHPGWIGKARSFLQENTQYAVVCGRRRERFPEQSIFNKLCDIEWDTPIGDAMACGGDAFIRADAFKQVKGYRKDLIAGEEPEMCFRLRQQGWKIQRLDVEMTLHDAAMLKLSQWWKRTVRTGYAFALGSSINGKSKERYWVKETQRIMFWGILLPALIIALTLFNSVFLLLVLVYLMQIVRVGWSRPDLADKKFIWATSVVLGKLPEASGLIRFWLDRFRNNKIKIIEYK